MKGTKFQVESDEDELSFLSPPKVGKNGELLAPCGRPAFGANPVNKKYNSRYRTLENQNKLGGRLLELGRASGIVAMTALTFHWKLPILQTGCVSSNLQRGML